MLSMWHFVAILVAILGILVTLVTVIIAVLKLGRNTVTKDDLTNNIESLRSEMLRMFAKMEANFEQLRTDMDRRFAEAATNLENVRVEARDERKAINAEIIRQNQNYIEHLAYHDVKPILGSEADNED